MKRGWFILLVLGLSACIRVDFSEGPTPLARYVCKFDWGLPAGVEPTAADTVAPLYVALARTTQTIHDTCHILIPSLDTLIRDSVPKGDYHAIAFGGPIDAPDQNDNTDKFYRLDNYDQFYSLPTTVGLADISLLLPPEPVGGSVDTSDPNVLCLEHLRQSAPFPVVQQARPVWLASDYRSLESGETVNTFQFAMQKMMQELTLRIRIDFDESQCDLQGLAFSLNGVPRRLNLLNGSVHQGETVSSSSDKSDIGTLLTKDITLVGRSGNQHIYACTLSTLGLFSPASEVEVGSWGVVEVAVRINGKNVKSRKINLYRLLKDHPVMSELGSAGDYHIAVSSAVLDVSAYAYLSLSPSSELEDETALEEWPAETDEQHIPIRPEDE